MLEESRKKTIWMKRERREGIEGGRGMERKVKRNKQRGRERNRRGGTCIERGRNRKQKSERGGRVVCRGRERERKRSLYRGLERERIVDSPRIS